MQVQLKAKHFFLIANLIKSEPIEKYLNLITSIKNQCSTVTDNEQLITVDCSSENIIEIYTKLGNQSENLFAGVNAEMKQALLPQVQTGAANGNAEWIAVGTYVQGMDANIDTQINQLYDAGRQFITQ